MPPIRKPCAYGNGDKGEGRGIDPLKIPLSRSLVETSGITRAFVYMLVSTIPAQCSMRSVNIME